MDGVKPVLLRGSCLAIDIKTSDDRFVGRVNIHPSFPLFALTPDAWAANRSLSQISAAIDVHEVHGLLVSQTWLIAPMRKGVFMADTVRHWIEGAWTEGGPVANTVAVYSGEDHARFLMGGSDEAQAAIVNTAKSLADSGEIIISGGGDEDELVF